MNWEPSGAHAADRELMVARQQITALQAERETLRRIARRYLDCIEFLAARDDIPPEMQTDLQRQAASIRNAIDQAEGMME